MRIEEEARNHVEGRRQEDYGTPQENHYRTALLWRAWIEAKYRIRVPLTGVDVCRMNQQQKFARGMHQYHRDESVDNVGYEINVAKIMGEDNETK